MKAIRIHRFGGPEVLQYEDVPVPEPGAGQVRIKVAGVGVNFADLMRRMGSYGTVDLPNIPGLEAAGTIDAVGASVTALQLGQQVMTRTAGSGGYAEYLVVDAANVFPCPAGIDLVEAGGMPVVFLTAYHLLKTRGQMQAGDTVLIQAAASGVGTIATQLAKRWGAHVIATASTEEKLALARSLGANHTINYLTHDFEEEVQRLTNGAGVQVILECVGGEVLEKSLRCLAPYGRLVTYGNASGKAAYLPAAEIFPVNRSVIGFSIGRSPQGILDHQAAMAEMRPLLEAKQVRPIVDRRLPMADVAKAHVHLANRGTRGKVILVP
jgi:NADPH:quinone reductase